MKKIILLSGHYYNSKRKAGFHFIAKELDNLGYKVVFITIPFSILNFIKDNKIREEGFIKNILNKQNINGITSIVNFSLLHPVNRNNLTIEKIGKFFFYLSKESIKEIKDANYIIFESTPAILFFEKIKQINPSAKLIYRMSDDLELLGASKLAVQYEKKILDKFDLVSVPSKYMYDKFSKISPKNIKLHFHGIDKSIFEKNYKSPYKENTTNLIFVGISHLDKVFINIASDLFPSYYFHIIGPFDQKIKKKNVIYHGLMKFEDTIPFIKFANIGLATWYNKNNFNLIKTFSDSLKILQYSYCKLPIIMPSIIDASHRKNVFYYDYGNEESIKKAISNAMKFDRKNFKDNINSWYYVVNNLLGDVKNA